MANTFSKRLKVLGLAIRRRDSRSRASRIKKWIAC
jgi:hypothetical protein